MTQQKLPEKLSFVLNHIVSQHNFIGRALKQATVRADTLKQTACEILPSDIMTVFEEIFTNKRPQPGRVNLPVMFNEYQAVIEEMVSRLYPEPNGENNYEKLKILFDTE